MQKQLFAQFDAINISSLLKKLDSKCIKLLFFNLSDHQAAAEMLPGANGP